MSLQCCCLSEDADYLYECFSEGWVKARKEHKCCECDRPILNGEKYLKSPVVHERQWHPYHTCLGCARLIDAYSCGGRVFGKLAQDIHDCFGTTIIYGEEDEDDDE